jgi:hypothetical protein
MKSTIILSGFALANAEVGKEDKSLTMTRSIALLISLTTAGTFL